VSAIDALRREYLAARGMAAPVITTGRKAIEEAEELVEAIASGDTEAILCEVADLALVAAAAADKYGSTVEDAIRLKIAKDTGRGEPSPWKNAGK
jgi:NTP pyrophosphatase (non-canonical NTP hydrolase)